jgi:hypothetical protein
MMEATEVMYLFETLRSKKEAAEGYDGVKVFTDLMTAPMDSQDDLLLDSLLSGWRDAVAGCQFRNELVAPLPRVRSEYDEPPFHGPPG